MRHLAIEGYENPVIPLFSPCGRWLYGRAWGVVVAWDLNATNTEPAWIDSEFYGMLFRLIISPCGRYLAGAEDRCVVVWDTTTRGGAKWIRANAEGDHISDVAFTPDSKHLLTACLGDGGVQWWRTGSWRRKPAFGTRAKNDGALTVSPDGRTVATADCGKKDEKSNRIKLWNYPKGTLRKTSPHACGSIVSLEFSPDSALIATNDNWQRVQIWSAKTLKPIAEYTPSLKSAKKNKKAIEPLNAFAFHPSGRFLAVGGQAGLVEFVDTNTWGPTVSFDWKLGHTYGVAFSPDGTLAAAGSDTGKVVVWDVDV